jgi:hypothetical protein
VFGLGLRVWIVQSITKDVYPPDLAPRDSYPTYYCHRLENSLTLCLSLMHIFDPRFTMRIAPSNSSRCQSNVREGSNGRDRDGDMASTGGASGSIAARIKQRSNKRDCLSLSSQAQVTNNHEAHDQENQDQRPNREEEDSGLAGCWR